MATPIISPQYCSYFSVDLNIIRKIMTISEGKFAVIDANGETFFKVKGDIIPYFEHRTLLDNAGNPIITFRNKIIRSLHDRWQVYRGESMDSKDLIFSVKRSSFIQLKTKLYVFLANNTKEDVCDYKVKGKWFKGSCVVYARESNTVVAKMHKKFSLQSVLLGKENFSVTVEPNVDHAFIVALIVILEEINNAVWLVPKAFRWLGSLVSRE